MPLNAEQSKRRRKANLLDLDAAQSMVNISLFDDETVS
jgi:hypothetical protein